MEEDVTYGNYSQYKFFDGVELEWPFEIAEDIAMDIVSFVRRNIQISEVNSVVKNFLIFFVIKYFKSIKFCKNLRERLDMKYGKCWHVFAGKNFGAYSVHDRYQYMYFKYKSYYFLIYKTTV
jgi:hypothetical protein